MNDCPNAEIRDQLPDFLHERLDVSARTVVIAHLSDCVDCQAELELLRDMLGMLTVRAPRMDVAYIVGALPKAPVRAAVIRPITPVNTRRSWGDWRIAAAVTLLVAGGSSVAVMNRAHFSPDTTAAVVGPIASAPTAAQPSTSDSATPATSVGTTAETSADPITVAAAIDVPSSSAEVVTDGRLAELNESQLKTLLNEINDLQPVPVTDPDPVTIHVDADAASLRGGI